MPDSAGAAWSRARTFHHSLYPAAAIAAAKAKLELSVSVCLPARECAGTVGQIVAVLSGLREAGAIDEIVVIDAASADGTAEVARQAGASVHQEAELMPELGPVLGKGDAMYRALSVLSGDLVCYLDADTESFSSHFATGLLGPLLCEQNVSFVKAFYRRPIGGVGARAEVRARVGVGVGAGAGGGAGADMARADVGEGAEEPDGGGRVNHLMARPALALFYPELAGVRQPLAGEVAARRELLEKLPFATGYGVEIAMLIDVWRAAGLDAIAQVDLDEHRNRHQPLAALVPMAETVLATIARRLQREGRLTGLEGGPDAAPLERPPLREARAAHEGQRACVDAPATDATSGAEVALGAELAREAGAAR
ncbi:MAG TPA: glucosyl-3-phosphoglycerate synthase [Solirubrobacteraceae bacterium]|nr:glucosyl-3-phosphoglycerate synthase [Solirubrobacteraceae bacterium]